MKKLYNAQIHGCFHAWNTCEINNLLINWKTQQLNYNTSFQLSEVNLNQDVFYFGACRVFPFLAVYFYFDKLPS
jgi:hypothetical protein